MPLKWTTWKKFINSWNVQSPETEPEETENITSNKTESVIKNSQQIKVQD